MFNAIVQRNTPYVLSDFDKKAMEHKKKQKITIYILTTCL